MTMDRNVDSKITPEALDRARRRIGDVTSISHPFNNEASRDTIRHWVEALGDDNPLWTDPEYAKGTPYGDIIAPPSFLFSCNQGPAWRGATSGGFRGFPGVHRFWSGDSWEYFQLIERGDVISGETYIKEFIEHPNSTIGGGLAVEDVAMQTFYNQRGDKVAEHELRFFNTERRSAAKKGKHREFTEHVWTEDEIQSLWADIDEEKVRGAETLYWDDVEVGEEIPQVIKGPLNQCEIVAFNTGWGGPFILASEIAQRYARAHPKANVPDRDTNAPDFPMRAHWDRGFAREVGAPSAYDYGGQRIAWIIHGLTNWCGDAGMVRGVDGKLTGFNVQGDATWCKARVTDKQIVDGEPLVFLDTWGENQDGRVTVTAAAKVRLPKRG